ncbi:DNA polymerase III subunit epsilon [Ancylobacter sp. G4_0304]|uniref:DNA polymerase III subunit epsilon n=1 Tax=Ancylobacter sp. G4_0304 TaxID=3114289 RepID=UPI0039C5D9C2
MREIVLDTETTGLDPLRGDRLVELGCVEILNRIPTGQSFHVYINPERDMPVEAFNVHGLSAEFLADKPLFSAVVDDFLAFIGDDPLVIHNAAFDIGFLNAELARLGKPALTFDRVVDTLSLARRRHPGQSNRLDDLMSRYGIDSSRRTKHGALLDSELLAEVYAELCGGRQTALGLMVTETRAEIAERREAGPRQRPAPLPSRLSAEELAAHQAFIATLGEAALWKEYAAGEA